jgi:hypothetical protein
MGTKGIWYWGLALFLFFSNAYSSACEETPDDIISSKYFLWKQGRPGFEGITCGRYLDDLPTSGKPYERLFSPLENTFSLNDKQYAVVFKQFDCELYKIFTEGKDELSITHLAEAINLSGSPWVKFYTQDTSSLETKYRGLADLLPSCALFMQAFEIPRPA